MPSKELKKQRIEQLLSIVKLACLLFPTVITLQNLASLTSTRDYLIPYSVFIAIILGFTYYIWSFATKKKISPHYSNIIALIEHFILGLILFSIILLSGGVSSPNKFIFIFIIITATIQLGYKSGLYVAGISSLAILGMDLYLARDLTINPYFENDLSLSGVFLLTAWILGTYAEAERTHINYLEEMVNYDGLTKVYNHRYFFEQLQQDFEKAKLTQSPLTLLFIDIDYFKFFNDVNGHLEGDKVLAEIGQILQSNIGKKGTVARYGGEEFAVLLPNVDHQEGTLIAEHLRKTVEETPFDGEENQPNNVLTISLGIATYPREAKDSIELIKCADDALYRAKFFDKNRVEPYSSILDELEKNISKEDLDVLNSIKTLVNMINIKDRYTYGHVERVVLYSKRLAETLGLTEMDKRTLVCGAYIHDVGKIDINESILIKRMPLTDDEWEKLREHPIKGEETIKYVNCLQQARPLVRHHHERYDGTGYPDKLKGEEIPYLARVLTVVDSFDAMTSNRVYNTRKSYAEAIVELERCKGTQFDPLITDAFIEMIRTSEPFK
nr:diguanylate cyclase [uncultured Niameybacter sp.]